MSNFKECTYYGKSFELQVWICQLKTPTGQIILMWNGDANARRFDL